MQDIHGDWLYKERFPEVEACMSSEYREGRTEYQQFKVFPASRLNKIWTESSQGIFRDTKGLHLLADLFIENTLRLMVNTILAEHTQQDGKQYAEDLLDRELTDEEFEKIQSWFIDTETGHWNISDYGLDKLLAKCIDIRRYQMEDNPQELLMHLDMGLNIIHQRFDLASLFIENGSTTLSQLAMQS